MKRKIALLLSILSVVLMLGACGTTDPTKVDYNGKTYNELFDATKAAATMLKEQSKEELIKQKDNLELNYGEQAALTIELIDKWVAAMDICGNFVSVQENSFSITKSGKTLTTDLVLNFENREVVFQLVYSYHNMEMTGITIEPVDSFGEKMTKAALNTLICMSIVFVVLIFISLIISCFKIFPYLEAKKKEKAAALQQTVVQPVASAVPEAIADNQDDTELVAVIAAAIAAYEGTSTSDFVVRSIRRRYFGG